MEQKYEEVIRLLKKGESISPEQEVLLFGLDVEYFCTYVASQPLRSEALDAISAMDDDEANKWMHLYMENIGASVDFSNSFALPMIKRAEDSTLLAMCGKALLSEEQQLAIFNRPDAKKFIMRLHKEGCGVEGQALQKAEDLGWL